jgi:hypothetical protein
MRRALVLFALVAWPRVAHARDSALEAELRVARSSFGMRADSMSGSGVDDYYGARSLTVSTRDEGYRRPTFTVVSLALGLSAPYAAIFATLNAGTGAADEAPTAGYEPALNAGASRLIALGLEPQVRAPLGPVTFALGLHAAYGWISAQFRTLRSRAPCRTDCGGRATGSQVLLTPRAVVTWDAFHLFKQSSLPTAFTLSAFAGLDVLYGGPGFPPLEAGLAIGLATPFGQR